MDTLAAGRKRNWFLWTIVFLLAAATALRFFDLEDSPPGFYRDEAAISARVICLGQSADENSGERFPLFSSVLAGGYATPGMLYGGVVWTRVFGRSVASLRSFAALHGALTIAGIFFLAQALWKRRDIAWLAALCGALSPWGFHLSRIAWDPPLAPCYLVCGLALILSEGKFHKSRSVLGGLLISLACYSYPPMRLQAALILPVAAGILIWKRPKLRICCAIAAAAFLISVLPLVRLSLSDEFLQRTQFMSITNPQYLRQVGDGSPALVFRIFLQNLGLNFSPRYLFLTGDANLRHSTQRAGEWNWLDMFALISAVLLMVRTKMFRRPEEFVIPGLLCWGYLAAVIPAALTWQLNPHALRSVGAWPFLAIGSGFALGRLVDVWPRARAVIPVLAILFALWYFPDYFAKYPERSQLYFDIPIVEQARASRSLSEMDNAVRRLDPAYPELALRYFAVSSGIYPCEELR